MHPRIPWLPSLAQAVHWCTARAKPFKEEDVRMAETAITGNGIAERVSERIKESRTVTPRGGKVTRGSRRDNGGEVRETGMTILGKTKIE